MTDWREWHRAYDDPGSSLSRRLGVVRARLGEALDAVSTTQPRLVSLCAGDGRDVVSVLGARADGGSVQAVLVELVQLVQLVELDEVLAEVRADPARSRSPHDWVR